LTLAANEITLDNSPTAGSETKTMKTKKLMCQGCGADVDPVPGEKYVTCAYCGTTNVLESDTIHLAPGTTVPQPPPGGVQIPQVQIRLPTGPSTTEVKKAGKIVALVVLSVVIAFVGIGATVFIRIFRGVSDATKQHRNAFRQAEESQREMRKKMQEKANEAKRILNERLSRMKRSAGGGAARAGRQRPGAFRMESDRPLAADVNEDGIADLLVRGAGGVVAALDGTSAAVLWRKTMSGGYARKIFVVEKTVLVAHGMSLTALTLKDGQQRWTTKLPDRADQLERRGSDLAIETGDDERLTLNAATGKKQPGRTAPFKVLAMDDGRKWMSNLGPAFRLTGRTRRARMYYCRHGQVLRGRTVTRRSGPFISRSTTYGCRDKRALVFAVDQRGRQAFIIGLQKGRGKVWEHPLAGRAQRFGGSTPVVDIHGDRAAVVHKDHSQATLMLLSMTTGKLQWTHAITGRRPNVRGVVLTHKRVFLRVDSWVEILDAATGKPPKVDTTPGAALPAP
jgi:outer membrane protein assembly factor BamB